MNHNPAIPPTHKKPSILLRLLDWAAHRRRTAAGLVLRGLCYGLGTGAGGLAAVWIEQHL